MTEETVPAIDNAWDNGDLGSEEKHARVAKEVDNEAIDKALDLVPVSIRLQRALIHDFKMIAKRHGIGYQPLMRQVLTRFAVAETRQIANDLMREQRQQELAMKASQATRKRA